MPPTPPQYGQGPANFAGQGGSGPFAPFNNQIDYQAMMRYQMVAQYRQQQPVQYNLPEQMQRQVLTDPKYSYGVQGGLDPSYYNRQAALNRSAYAGAITTGALSSAAWSAVSAPLAAAGFAGASVFLPAMALTAPITGMIAGRVDQNLTRQKYMHSIAMDLQQNRNRLGMNALSYNEATAAGASVAGMIMDDKGKFFSKEQMMRIQKIGLTEGMLDNSGSVSRYKRNVKDLIDATEDIVKTLQTTIEGGMSIIKEVNQIGFKTLPQVRSAIRSAKASGMSTGLGMQNMMHIGAAGAQAVQGTPWTAATGASMFQMGAVQAHAISAASPAAARTVERAGGVGQAGASIASFAMNVLQSGMGTRFAAYAMNPDGTMNNARLNDVLSGNVSAYQLVSGANQTGYQMGANRVRFGMFKEDLLNQMNDAERMRGVNEIFNMWRKGRGGGALNQAAVFAGQFTNDPVSQRLAYEMLKGPTGMGRLTGMSRAQDFMGASAAAPGVQSGPVGRFFGTVGRGIKSGTYAATDWTMNAVTGGGAAFSALGQAVGKGAFDLTNAALRPFGGGGYGLMARNVNYGDPQRAAMVATGMIGPGRVMEGLKAFESASKGFSDFSFLEEHRVAKVPTGVNLSGLLRKDPEEIQWALQNLNTMITNNTAYRAADHNRLMQFYGITDKSKFFDFGFAVNLYQETAAKVKAPRNTIARMEKDIADMKPGRKRAFQEHLLEAKHLIATRKEGVDAFIAVSRMRGASDIKQMAGEYAANQYTAKRYERLSIINPLQYNAEGLRSDAIRRFSAEEFGVNRWAEGVTGALQGTLIGLGTTIGSIGGAAGAAAGASAGGFLAGATGKFVESKLKDFFGRRADVKTQRLIDTYESAVRKEALYEDLDRDEKKALKYKDDPMFQSALRAKDKALALEFTNYTNSIAENYRIAAGKRPGEAFTGEHIRAASFSVNNMRDFFERHEEFWGGKKADVIMAGILEGIEDPDSKAGKEKARRKFYSWLGETAVKKAPSASERFASIYADYSLAKTQRDQLLKAGGKDKEAIKEETQEMQDKLDEMAILRTEMAINQRGKSGNVASVSTPILNYWNNRWVL